MGSERGKGRRGATTWSRPHNIHESSENLRGSSATHEAEIKGSDDFTALDTLSLTDQCVWHHVVLIDSGFENLTGSSRSGEVCSCRRPQELCHKLVRTHSAGITEGPLMGHQQVGQGDCGHHVGVTWALVAAEG